MSRVLKFCNMQAYQTGSVYSEIFDVTDIGRIDTELRIMATGGTTPTITALFQTTSDPTFDDNAWQPLGSSTFGGAGTGTVTGSFSGLGRFLRAKLTVAGSNGIITACLQAVGRDP